MFFGEMYNPRFSRVHAVTDIIQYGLDVCQERIWQKKETPVLRSAFFVFYARVRGVKSAMPDKTRASRLWLVSRKICPG